MIKGIISFTVLKQGFRARFFFCFLSITFLSACAHRVWIPPYKIHRDVLLNGLTVLYVEDHTSPIVSYATLFKVGSAYEKEGSTGIAHLLEHLTFKGTARYGPKQFLKTLESKGAIVNAFTQRETTVYYELISSQYLELVIDMESDRLKNLRFTDSNVDAERKIVKEERRLRIESNFFAQQMEELQHLSFPSHPYGQPVIGSMHDLDQLSTSTIQDFFNTYYQPGNAIIVITGDFNYEQTKSWITKYYGSIAGTKVRPPQIVDEPALIEEKRKEMIRPIQTESLLIGYRIPSIYDIDSPKLSMLGWALFGMTSSRAHIRLVREKKIALSVSGDALLEKHPFLFFISVEMKKGIPATVALEELGQMLDEAKKNPISEEELNRVKNWITYNTINEAKSPVGVGNWLASGELYWNDYRKVFHILDRYNAMSVADLTKACQKYFKKENRVVVIMKPEPTAYAKF